jgi:signal-transduction protein with cAMP-binding, CBS, and nucleotidyltransferase domain
VIGILTRTELLVALAEHGKDHPVAAVMRRDFLVTDYTEMLETAFQRLQECECHTMPVVHDGRLVGLLTMDNLGEYFLIQAAMKKSDTRPGIANGLVRRGAAETP